MSGLYIHIPFCKTRCIYCGFFSTVGESMKDRYVDALCDELKMRRNYIGDAVRTIYIGGGTPSQLSEKNIEKIIDTIYKYYDVEAAEGMDVPEMTMECNPDDVDSNFASFIANTPINRISMGAQSFSDEMLRFAGRRHDSSQIHLAVERLRKADIGNISIDLMFGFPGETEQIWQDDLRKAIELDVEHLSAYSLMFEEGTPLYKMLQDGRVKEIDEDLSLSMFNTLLDTMNEAGFEHYEISNFARQGFRSRHNSSYWHDIPYLGVGASAHSFNGTSRQWNVCDVKQYISYICSGSVPAEVEVLSKDSRFDDIVMTSLRTREGINLEGIRDKFGTDYLEFIEREARKHVESGLLRYDDGGKRLALTRKGIFVSDDIMADLMHV